MYISNQILAVSVLEQETQASQGKQNNLHSLLPFRRNRVRKYFLESRDKVRPFLEIVVPSQRGGLGYEKGDDLLVAFRLSRRGAFAALAKGFQIISRRASISNTLNNLVFALFQKRKHNGSCKSRRVKRGQVSSFSLDRS